MPLTGYYVIQFNLSRSDLKKLDAETLVKRSQIHATMYSSVSDAYHEAHTIPHR